MVFCDLLCDTNECSTNLIYASVIILETKNTLIASIISIQIWQKKVWKCYE
jgi:hypothetical protein